MFVIGDLHLGFSVNKPMDIFGAEWENHAQKLAEGFSCVSDSDTVVLLGDLSWGIKPAECEEDFRFIAKLPGRKLIVKGNHDYWWGTGAKMRRFFDACGMFDAEVINSNAFLADGTAICGTRGWFYDQNRDAANQKVFDRELMRLRASLDAAKLLDGEPTAFLHYPPLYEGWRCDEIVDMLTEYNVKRCFYGHLHGKSRDRCIEGLYKGIEYRLVSADHVNFKPVRV